MLFSYKGINTKYEYQRGTVNANSDVEAIKAIKEDGVLIVINMKKISSNERLASARTGFNNVLVNWENKINKKTNEIVNKDKKKSKKKDKDLNEDGEKKSITERSPILKAINKTAEKFQGNKNIVITEDTYADLQDMFKKMNESENKKNYDEFVDEDDLSTNKVKKTKRMKDKDKSEEKSIDWSLIDSQEDPENQENLKLKVKQKEVIMFTRRLHIMLSSGVPLLKSLMILQNSSGKVMTQVVEGIVEDIQLGNALSTAIAKYPNQFDATYVALISIGETAGSLEKSLEDLIKLKEQEQKVLRKIKVASIYPSVIGFVLVLLLIGISIFLPQFEAMFAEQDIMMPAFSTLVFGIADKMPIIIGTIIAILLTFIFLKKRIPELNYIYRTYKDRFMLKLPVIRSVTNASHMYSFSSTIALMLDNGIRLSDTLSLTGRTINNVYMKSEIEEISELIMHGYSFSEALSQQENFDEIVVNIALTGEESGRMVFSLQQVADYFETDLIRQIDSLLEFVQPVSIFLIALLVAPVIIAAYLPIFEISSGAGIL